MTKIRLTTPVPKEEILRLQLMDTIYVTGSIHTIPSLKALIYLLKMARKRGELPIKLEGAITYHCPAVIRNYQGKLDLLLVGSTTSSRFDPFTPEFIKRFTIRGIIGKGGMSENTLQACKKYGCVYFVAPGGCSPIYTKCVKRLKNIYWLEELGVYDAILEIEVEDFGPLFLTMDTRGNSIHNQVEERIKQKICK